MRITVHCPGCKELLEVASNASVRKARCPSCQLEFMVPSTDELIEETASTLMEHNTDDITHSQPKTSDDNTMHVSLDLVHQNPFRILGLPITATNREFAKRISDLSIFLQMGKTRNYDCDHFFPVQSQRTSESINDASQRIEQPQNKLFYALFWFWDNPANTIDQMAFEELKNGNINKAINFWEKATSNNITNNNCSNYKNLAVLYMGISFENGSLDKHRFLKSIHLSGQFMANGHFEGFIKHVIGSQHSIDPLEITDSYVDKIISLVRPYLEKTDGLNTKELINAFSSYPNAIQNIILDKFIAKHVHNIEHQINISKSRRKDNAAHANNIGFDLIERIKKDWMSLNSALSKSDLEYQLIADKLADELISCSICYFNELCDSNNDPGEDALKLAKNAKQFAVGDKIKERIDEGIPIFKEYVDEKPKRQKLKPVKAHVDYIYEQINNIEDADIFSFPLTARSLAINCSSKLNLIKSHIGNTDTSYLELCDLVFEHAFGMCVVYLNTVAKASNKMRSSERQAFLIKALFGIGPAINAIGELDMSLSNRSIFKDTCSKIGLGKTSSDESNCFIATMVYGSCDAPEVIVLRKFRDDVLLQSQVGRVFVKLYYRYSPLIVKSTEHFTVFHTLFRSILNPLVNYLKALNG